MVDSCNLPDKWPKNFEDLPYDDQIIISESFYKKQLIHKHGFFPGSTMLQSMDKIDAEMRRMQEKEEEL